MYIKTVFSIDAKYSIRETYNCFLACNFIILYVLSVIIIILCIGSIVFLTTITSFKNNINLK